MDKESLEVVVARIDENVKNLKNSFKPIKKQVDRHELMIVVILMLLVVSYPRIAEALAQFFK
jgi:flavin reductase (DIM6/NTAB) family NADH-FMN oxidoreductase RutF